MGSEMCIRDRPIVKPGSGGGFGFDQVPLEEVHYYFKTYKYNPDAITGLVGEFTELRRSAPFLLRDAIDQYISTLRVLQRGDLDDFEKNIRKARAKFATDYERAEKISAYLARFSAAERIPLVTLARRFGIRDSAPELPLEAAIDVFLDAVQRPGE